MIRQKRKRAKWKREEAIREKWKGGKGKFAKTKRGRRTKTGEREKRKKGEKGKLFAEQFCRLL